MLTSLILDLLIWAHLGINYLHQIFLVSMGVTVIL